MRTTLRAAGLAASLLLTVGLTGLALTACGGSSTADAQAQTAPSGMPQPNGRMGDPSAMLAKALDALVENGTITSEQQTKVVAAIRESMSRGPGGASQGGRPTPDAQPSSGTQPPDRGEMFSSALDALVADGTITATQEAAIEAALTQSMPGGPGGASAMPAAGV
jgi:hypothetical protein